MDKYNKQLLLYDKFKISQAKKILEHSNSIHLNNLYGSYFGLWFSVFYNHNPNYNLILVPNLSDLENLKQELSIFLPHENINDFPHYLISPYDNIPSDPSILARRFTAIANLRIGDKIMLSTVQAFMRFLPPPEEYQTKFFTIKVGKLCSREKLLDSITNGGYSRVELVEEKGEFAVRGSLVDIFPIQSDNPVRVDFFDDLIETIKFFEPESQSTLANVSFINVYPIREYFNTKNITDLDLQQLKDDSVNKYFDEFYNDLVIRKTSCSLEKYLPVFYKKRSILLDYFPSVPNVFLWKENQLYEAAEEFFSEQEDEFLISHDKNKFTPKIEQLIIKSSELNQFLKKHKLFVVNQFLPSFNPKESIDCFSKAAKDFFITTVANTQSVQKRGYLVLKEIASLAEKSVLVIITTKNITTANKIGEILQELGKHFSILDSKKDLLPLFFKSFAHNLINIIPTFISSSFCICDEAGNAEIIVINEEDIFGVKKIKRKVTSYNLDAFKSHISDFNIGDYVTHIEYGIAIYRGIKGVKTGDNYEDFMLLEYSDKENLFVPVEKFSLVQLYSTEKNRSINLNKLGEKKWLNIRAKVEKKIYKIAEELIRISGERKLANSFSFKPSENLMQEFANYFLFEETPDQAEAIKSVTDDLKSTVPMDRLICGDVGFGKTEVALRATFQVAIEGFQVAVVAPTTILAYQHFKTFEKRFASFDINIEMVSRIRSAKENKVILERVKQHKIDVIVGTHRLLSKDVQFDALGLLIIDEEQRFGVGQKEKIKKLRNDVNILTMTATPIPRTLNMSLLGIKDVSIIHTCPVNRFAIRTRVLKFNDQVIKEAVYRENKRQGQVFFLYNNVQTMEVMLQYLQSIVPDIIIRIAHGQMPKVELENTMLDFINNKITVLLCSTIIEAGLDIPNVNTIIINDAHKFGLAQLYQIRGRIGRSNKQAYAYLLLPQNYSINKQATRRLEVLQSASQLGSGFRIASYDLELRGIGNILGHEQSGHIDAVGYDTYLTLVEEAVKKLKNKEDSNTRSIILNSFDTGYIPASYIKNTNLRLAAYKNIANCQNEEQLWQIQSEIEDRFGKIPEVAMPLFINMKLRIIAKNNFISQLNITPKYIELLFYEENKLDIAKLSVMAQQNEVKLFVDNRVRIRGSYASATDYLKGAINFFEQLSISAN